jgi:hypothetical protein
MSVVVVIEANTGVRMDACIGTCRTRPRAASSVWGDDTEALGGDHLVGHSSDAMEHLDA